MSNYMLRADSPFVSKLVYSLMGMSS